MTNKLFQLITMWGGGFSIHLCMIFQLFDVNDETMYGKEADPAPKEKMMNLILKHKNSDFLISYRRKYDMQKCKGYIF